MTDPTKQQAATAKTAREMIKAHLEALDAVMLHWYGHDRTAYRVWAAPRINEPEVARQAGLTSHLLRALLDAPEGAVGRLVEAAEGVIRGEKVVGEFPRLKSALAALRASPESVGWLQAQAEAYNLRLLHERTMERDAAKKDAADWKSTLDMYAKAWKRELQTWPAKTHEIDALALGTQQLRERYEKALKDVQARYQEIIGLKVERHNALKGRGETDGTLLAIVAERDALKADIAAAARREALARQAEADIRVLKDRAEAELAAAHAELEQNDLAALKAAPPPATEAPVTERARLTVVSVEVGYEAPDKPERVGIVRFMGSLDDTRRVGALIGERVEVCAAAERAVKAPQAEG